MSANDYDVVFLGGGTGGYVAAIRASQLGLKAAVVEKDLVGGTCVHRGCIPAKSLLKAAEVASTVRKASEFGVNPGDVTLNYAQAMRRSRDVVDQNYNGIEYLFRKHKIDTFKGWGTLVSPREIRVESEDGETQTVKASKAVIIDTGSTPREMEGLESNGTTIINSDHATFSEDLPKRVIIRGAGATGLEFASVYHEFESEVTVVGNIAPNEDAEVARDLERSFKRQGINVISGHRPAPDDFEVSENGVKMKYKDDVIEADALLVAIGRYGNIEGFGLSDIGVETTDRGYIAVDDYMRTNVDGVYAIGDVTGLQQLAHTAMHQGIVAVEHIAGHKPHALAYNKIPWVTFCHPEIGSVGLTEQEAKDAGYNVKTGKFPMQASGKARVDGDTTGFAKIVVDEDTDTILGVHILGHLATELIAEAGLAMMFEASAWELGITVHAHPTVSEIMHEAALATADGPLHL
ncbi:MAG: dihydrolipoyl dehydrogenase [Thermomicrobiales bacterium]